MSDIWDRLGALPDVAWPPAARAAVLVPLYADATGEVRVILTKRPDDMRTHPGDVVFPGGRMEGGESPTAAAKREAREEVGLPEAGVRVLGGLSPISTRRRSNLIVPVVARVDRPPALTPDPYEVDAVIEPTIAELLDEARWRTEEFMGHLLWFFEFDQGTLWGATGFMMRELLGYVRSGEASGGES